MSNNMGNETFMEKREKTRISCNFAAIVKGRDQRGREFEENARVLNLSASGIYLLLNRLLEDGQQLNVRIALPTGSLKLGTSRLVTEGIVIREESLSAGVMGVAVKFNHYRFR